MRAGTMHSPMRRVEDMQRLLAHVARLILCLRCPAAGKGRLLAALRAQTMQARVPRTGWRLRTQMVLIQSTACRNAQGLSSLRLTTRRSGDAASSPAPSRQGPKGLAVRESQRVSESLRESQRVSESANLGAPGSVLLWLRLRLPPGPPRALLQASHVSPAERKKSRGPARAPGGVSLPGLPRSRDASPSQVAGSSRSRGPPNKGMARPAQDHEAAQPKAAPAAPQPTASQPTTAQLEAAFSAAAETTPAAEPEAAAPTAQSEEAQSVQTEAQLEEEPAEVEEAVLMQDEPEDQLPREESRTLLPEASASPRGTATNSQMADFAEATSPEPEKSAGRLQSVAKEDAEATDGEAYSDDEEFYDDESDAESEPDQCEQEDCLPAASMRAAEMSEAPGCASVTSSELVKAQEQLVAQSVASKAIAINGCDRGSDAASEMGATGASLDIPFEDAGDAASVYSDDD
ncbi:unnamed protein product [Effrenium voratum]|nr:unnamed protein product [Effrenium voratum]